MDKIPFSNDTKSITFRLVDGVSTLISPGESRMVDDTGGKKMVETVKAPAGGAGSNDPIADFLKQPIKDIEPALADMDEAALNDLRSRELASDTPRSTLINLLDEQILERKTNPQG